MQNQQNVNQPSSSSSEKRKVKEALSTDELKVLLRGWLNALEQNQDFPFKIKGASGFVLKEVLLKGTTSGEYEFELELKWKEGAEKFQ